MTRPVLSSIALLLVCAAALAQTTGNIEGRVTDPSGTTLQGVTIEATSPSLQGTRSAVSGQEGLYRIPAVPPGQYRVRATLSLFAAVDRSAVVSLDATATVDFTLQIAAREEVTVSGDAPPVDVTSTAGTNYTSKIIERLPVSRNYADIVRSNPGVDPDRGETQGRSLALAIYGATSAENQWIVDGINTTKDHDAPGSESRTRLRQDLLLNM
jgi:carboxypeptidase family protein